MLPKLPAPVGLRAQAAQKRLVKANPERRAAFVREYVLLQAAAQALGAQLFFADEAQFYAHVDLRGKWVLRGEPALVDSTSPRGGEKVSSYSAVCLETSAVEIMELDGNSTAETSVVFLQKAGAYHPEPLIVLWDNGPAHSGGLLRTHLTTPGLQLRLVRLPAYSPDFNPHEAIWRGSVLTGRPTLVSRPRRTSARKWVRSSAVGLTGPTKPNAAAEPSSRPKATSTPLPSARSAM